MSKIIVRKSKNSIDFFDSGNLFYDLTLTQIKLHGVDYWLNHLSAKTWFNDEVKNQFLQLI